MSAHAILAPSAAPRWVPCSGSVALEAACPEQAKAQEALEGDAAHHIAAETLRQMQRGVTGWAAAAGDKTPNGVVVDDEMIEAADMFVADVVEKCGDTALEVLHIEEKVSASNLVHPQNEGTPDVWFAAMAPGAGAYLFIHDFKYGHGFVDAFENWQLIDYAAGILERTEFANIPWNRIEIVFSIVQPRNFHQLGPIRRWTITAEELRPYFAQLRVAAYKALGPDCPTTVGPHCRDCTGRFACDALHAAADTVADIAGTAVPMELPPVALGVELRMLERADVLLKARLTGLREQAKATIRAGIAVPFFTVEQGLGRETWTKPVAEVLALGTVLGVDLAKPVAAITPAQARKAGVMSEVVAAYAERPKGELKLVPADTNQARKVFAQ